MVSTGKMLAFINALGGGAAAPSEVVILPETEITAIQESPITTAPSAVPKVGAVCAVTYNGTAYDCPALSIPAGLDMTGVLLGNSDAVGAPGGNATAPFLIMFFDTPADVEGVPVYGMFVPMEEFAEGAVVTLSIVQVGAASGGESAGGGIFEVNVSATSFNASTGHDFSEFDKTFAELVAAQNAGKYVRINVSWNVGVSSYGNVILYGDAGDGTQFIVSMPQSYTAFRQTTYYILTAGENGEIVTQLIGAD